MTQPLLQAADLRGAARPTTEAIAGLASVGHGRPARPFSRAGDKTYVQDRLLADAPRLRELVAQGAQVLVCGGRRMAEGVAAAWERILAGSNLSVASLRMQGRYVEDVY